MLSLGPGSICDVCLEPFGQNDKTPCSITCGHVFCADCLDHITRPSCPLCRTHFDQRSRIKLHLDVDNVRPSSLPVKSTPSTGAEQEARRLQEAIANIANEGTTEAKLRQLITEGRAFLQSQPRNLFSDLRVSHRMIAYLCEVKSTLRDRNLEVDNMKELVESLNTEKGELQKKVEELNQARKYEQETALAVEMSLREHCSKAHTAYETMIEQYNFVVRQWMSLYDEVRDLRSQGDAHFPMPITGKESPRSHNTPQISTYQTPNLNQRKLKGAAVQDPDSFLISPLPEFTGKLPPASDSFVTLPEVEEMDEDEDEPTTSGDHLETFEQPKYHSAHCNAAGHPLSCDCEPSPVFSHSSSHLPNAPIEISHRPSFSGHSSSDRRGELQPPSIPETPSRISRSTSGEYDAELRRSSSIPSRTNSRSRPSSRPPTRSSSPTFKSPKNSQVRGATSSRDTFIPSSAHLSIPQGREGEVLRSRLHNLLHDSNTSSSLPNMPSSHFPTSVTREVQPPREEYVSRPPSRSGSSSSNRLNQQQSTSDNYSHLLASSQPPAIQGKTPFTTPSPNPHRHVATSSASSAALAIEKAQRERQRLEKEQEKERRKAEKERAKAERERERSSADSERSRASMNSQASAQHREPINIYGNPNNSGVGTLSRRSSNAGASYTRSSSGVTSSLREPTVTLAQQPRYPSAGNSKVLSTAVPTSGGLGIHA